jgi:hypothetical protein
MPLEAENEIEDSIIEFVEMIKNGFSQLKGLLHL